MNTSSEQQTTRKSYESPRLEKLGDLATITRGTNPTALPEPIPSISGGSAA